MARKMTLILMVAMGVGLLADGVSAAEVPAIMTQKDKASYGIGVNVARNFQRQGIEVDLDLVIKGLKDGFSGQKLLIPERELRRVLIMYQTELRRKQVRTKTLPDEVRKREGEVFLANNKTKEGTMTLPSGLQYKILKAGEGRKPTDADTVEVNFRGTFIDGIEFDSSQPGQPATFKVKG